MTAFDRFLLLVAIFSGVLAARPAVAGPDEPGVTCTDKCQNTQMYFHCIKKNAYQYEGEDCYHCTATGAGQCEDRASAPGGVCKKRDTLRKWHYLKDYKMPCDCGQNYSRVEISSGVKNGNWDVFDGDYYHTCEKSTTGGS